MPLTRNSRSPSVTASSQTRALRMEQNKEPGRFSVASKGKVTSATSRIGSSVTKQFPWIKSNIKNPRSVKLLVRCWLASWLAVVIILPYGPLQVLGNAAFFVGIASLLVPANMPIQSFILSMTTMVSGCLLGWAWGCAAMRAALSARNQTVTLRKLQQIASLSQREQQSSIFHGDFLDTRSTIVYGVFLGFAAFVLGFVRASRPKLTLPTIFCGIFIDVISSYGPLFPTAQYTILSSFVISTGFYVAIGLLVIILVFPQTLNHEWLSGYVAILGSIKELIDLQDQVLEVEVEDLSTDLEKEDSMLNLVRTKEEQLVTSFQGLSAKTSMLPMEFSYGQLSGEDLQALELPLKNLVTRTRGLQSFVSLLASHSELRQKLDNNDSDSDNEDDNPGTHTPWSRVHIKDTHRVLCVRRRALDQEIRHKLRIEDVLPVLKEATAELRKACSVAVQAAKTALEEINTRRYKRHFDRHQALGEHTGKREGANGNENGSLSVSIALQDLKSALQAFRSSKRMGLLEPFTQLLKSSYQLDRRGLPPFSLRPLFLCFVFQSNLMWTADSLISLLSYIEGAQSKRSGSTLWAPKHLSKLWGMVFRKDDDEGSAREPLGNDLPPLDPFLTPGDGGDDDFAKGFQKDPDSSAPKNFGQKLGNAFHIAYMWFKTPEAIFATKNLIVTIALWLPAVIPSSAFFTYSQRGLWALIMGQMTLSVYMAEQIVSYAGRIIGTVIGGLFGMVAWYIGSGHGKGNPYGIAASAGVLLVPAVFYRLFGPVPMSAIMVGITGILVVGYSWVDTQLNTIGNPGVGWDVAWRRVLLVLVGSAASFLLMLLPPQSRRRDVRVSNASMITDISRLYAALLSSWLADVEEGQDLPSTPTNDPFNAHASTSESREDSIDSYSTWAPAFRTKVIKIAARLRMLRQETAAARWEGNLRGSWPHQEYERLVAVQSRMINNLVQLASSLAQLNPSWRRTLLHRTSVLNPNLVADVMAVFGIVSMSLRTGEAIHEVLPRSLMDRVFYHQSMASTRLSKQYEGPELLHHGEEVLTPDALQSEEFAIYATGVAAVFQILLSLDELHRIARVLCGEVPLKGFEHWRDEFEMRQLGRRV